MTAQPEGGAGRPDQGPVLRPVTPLRRDQPVRDPGRIGPYRVIQRIGEGGMGLVYLALDGDGRAVAVKVLRAHVAADPDARARLAREVATLRRVQHPAVAEVLDADVDGDLPYLVTRYVPGRPLEELVADHGPLPPEQVAHLGRLLGEALTTIHAAGVVHRDVKPGNVMILDGDPVLIDFGIAHLADETRLTMTGLVMGTPGYLAPEVMGGQPLTSAGDWWGWGATLAFAATGRPPFGTGPLEVVLDRVRRADADLAGLADGLRPAVRSALTTDPSQRGRPPALVDALDEVTPTVRFVLPPTAAVDREAPTVRTPMPPPPPAPPSGQAPPLPPAPAPAQGPAQAWARPPAPTSGHPPAPAPGSRPAVPVGPPPAPPMVPPVGPPAPASQVAPEGPDAPVRVRRSPVDTLGWEGFRTAVLLGSFAALSATAAVSVGGALALFALLAVLLRTVDRSVARLGLRRAAYGPRGSDPWVTAFATPWRVVESALSTLVWSVVPLLVGGSVLFLGFLAVGQGGQPVKQSPPVQAIAMATLLLAAWWGPGGGALRRGTELSVRWVARRRIGSWVLLGLIALVVLAALLVVGRAR